MVDSTIVRIKKINEPWILPNSIDVKNLSNDKGDVDVVPGNGGTTFTLTLAKKLFNPPSSSDPNFKFSDAGGACVYQVGVGTQDCTAAGTPPTGWSFSQTANGRSLTINMPDITTGEYKYKLFFAKNSSSASSGTTVVIDPKIKPDQNIAIIGPIFFAVAAASVGAFLIVIVQRMTTGRWWAS